MGAPTWVVCGRALAVVPLLLGAIGCGTPRSTEAVQPEARTPTPSAAVSATASASATTSPTTPAPRASSASPTAAATSSCDSTPARLSLKGKTGRAFAFAPLGDFNDVVVEGTVSDTRAWSTSKVLIVAAYLDTVVDGNPKKVPAADRRRVTAALTESDGNAVNALRDRIPGRPGRAMTAVLRSIGDRTTVAPDTYQGTMTWSLREQVRFLVALEEGRVVSKAASAYLLEAMQPIKAHAWGLGTVDATSYKGGWLRSNTATRQLGLVDGYAVAIITDRGPAVRQTDGDAAHVQETNKLARLLRDRLAYENTCR